MRTESCIVTALKQQWFTLAQREEYPETPDVTHDLDKLESEIKSKEKTHVGRRLA